MYGARGRPVLPPHRAARQERARRARPRRRLRHPPARPADERLADRDPRLRLAVLAGTVRRVGGPEHEPMRAGRDRPTGQARPRRVHRARRTGRRRWRSGPCHRRCAPPGLPVRWRGGTAVGRGHRGASATAATPPVLVAPCASRIPNSLAASRIEAPLRGAWRLASDNEVRSHASLKDHTLLTFAGGHMGGPCRAEQCPFGFPLPGLGPAPSGGLITNSRRTGQPHGWNVMTDIDLLPEVLCHH